MTNLLKEWFGPPDVTKWRARKQELAGDYQAVPSPIGAAFWSCLKCYALTAQPEKHTEACHR